MARPSHVRTAIAELICASSRHDWTIEAVAATLGSERGVSADFSSVFRGLERLVEEGVVRRVQLGDGRAHFEAAREHHEHIQCDECGVVREVPGCVVEEVMPAIERRTGFSISGHRLTFSGRCAACAGGTT